MGMPILWWLTRGEDVPYRLLEKDASLCYSDWDTDNMLIQRDNLEHSR